MLPSPDWHHPAVPPPAPAPAELITYNATTQGGVNVTLARSEATKRLQEILAEEKVLREEIDVSGPPTRPPAALLRCTGLLLQEHAVAEGGSEGALPVSRVWMGAVPAFLLAWGLLFAMELPMWCLRGSWSRGRHAGAGATPYLLHEVGLFSFGLVLTVVAFAAHPELRPHA